MKQINNYIIEKLRINKDTKTFLDKDIHDFENVKLSWPTAALCTAYNHRESLACMKKMQAYYNKKSKPLTLVHTIKDRTKLVQRFLCAVLLKWDTAILTFKDAIIERDIMKEEDIDAYFCQMYLHPVKIESIAFYYNLEPYKSNEENTEIVKQALENYFDLYSIKYEANK